jgi:hypothetical protein
MAGLQELAFSGMLKTIKVMHTVVWALMVGCIVALPVLAIMRRFDWALWLTLIVGFECAVLAVNHGRCPLTDLAARYTLRREHNFDIYLPEWIAEHNKTLFGSLFLVNEAFVLWCWLR